MSTISLFLLAAGLCFDTFAVSLSGGAGTKYTIGRITIIMLVLAATQTAMLVLGWLIGLPISKYISTFDHWIAFALLAFIGGKMIVESFEKDTKSSTNFHSNSVLFIIALATSIDAVAVGASLALIYITSTDLIIGSVMLFAVTAIAALVGLIGGNRLGAHIGRRAELIGGLILIGIGVKIVLEHLGVIG